MLREPDQQTRRCDAGQRQHKLPAHLSCRTCRPSTANTPFLFFSFIHTPTPRPPSPSSFPHLHLFFFLFSSLLTFFLLPIPHCTTSPFVHPRNIFRTRPAPTTALHCTALHASTTRPDRPDRKQTRPWLADRSTSRPTPTVFSSLGTSLNDGRPLFSSVPLLAAPRRPQHTSTTTSRYQL